MNTLRQWESIVRSVYHIAELTNQTSGQLQESLKRRVYDELARKSPKGRAWYCAYTQGYVRGLIQCAQNRLWTLVDFRYEYNGVLYSVNKKITPNTDSLYSLTLPQSDWQAMPAKFYWTGTDKVYY